MTLASRVRTRRNRPRNQHASPRKLLLEMLEDRTAPSATAVASAYGQLPLAFEANQGQAAPPVDFLARGNGYTLGLTAQDAHLDLGGGTALDLRLVGAAPSTGVGLDPLITKSNYLAGSDPSQWHTNIPNFGRVEYQNVYPGIALTYYGNQGQLEYDFVVAPGANPNAIKLSIQGAQSIALDSQGNLVLHTAGTDVIEQAPVVYQDIGGVRHSVAAKFVLQGNTVGFQIGAYDPSRPLVIDPSLSYSTYIGAQGDSVFAIAVDSSGNAYLTGSSTSNLEPFVAKLNAAGSALIYRTYLGGAGNISQGYGIAIDAAGDAYVTGYPGANFPTTANAYSQTASNGFVTVLDPTGANLIYSTYVPDVYQWWHGTDGAYSGGIAIDSSGNAYVTAAAVAGFPTTAGAYQSALAAGATSNAFLAEINPHLSGSASLVYGSYLGGGGTDAGTGVAVDASGNAYVTGYTNSSNFPTTTGAFQTTAGGGYDAFVAKFTPALSGSASLVYSTYLGGSGDEGFPTEVLRYGTGARALSFPTRGPAVAVDSSGDAFVAGGTASTNFPTTSGAYEPSAGSMSNYRDAFVTKLNPTGSGLVYSTYLGPSSPHGPQSFGSDPTTVTSIVVDASGNAYLTGLTRSTAFPVTSNAIQSKLTGTLVNIGTAKKPNWVVEYALAEAFVTTLNATGSSLLFSTYLGGQYDDFGLGLALDSAGNTYVGGVASSTDFPTTTGSYQPTAPFTSQSGWSGIVFKIDPPVEPPAAPPSVASRSLDTAGVLPPTSQGMMASLAILLPRSNPALSPMNGNVQPTPLHEAPPPQSARDFATQSRVDPQATTLLSGGDEDTIDQAFIAWQLDEPDGGT